MRVCVEVAEFGPDEACKGLAPGAADEHIDCKFDWAKIEIAGERFRAHRLDVAGFAV
jgi:hypothetical protein